MTEPELRKLYNSFAVKDLTYKEFAKQYQRLTDPRFLAQDLMAIQLTRARRRVFN